MASIDETISRVDRWLQSNRAEYYSHLQPAVSNQTLTDFEQRFSLELPADFRAFYQWRNGQPPTYFERLQGNWTFISMESIADSKEMLDGMIGSDFEEPSWWRVDWVPFLSNGGGDYLCLDLKAVDGGSPGQILTFWHDWEDREADFPSFRKWLESLADSMEDGTLELE